MDERQDRRPLNLIFGFPFARASADTNLGIKTFLNGALVSNIVVDTTAPETDTIDYVATNPAGTSTSTRTVIVEAPPSAAPTEITEPAPSPTP